MIDCHRVDFSTVMENMLKKRVPRGHWQIKENVIESAKSFNTRTAWQDAYGAAYNSARKKGWLDECSSHMEERQKPNGYWTLERCQARAYEFDCVKDWNKSCSGSYSRAQDMGWINEITKPWEEKKKSDQLTACIASAKKYSTRSEWLKNAPSKYSLASSKGWREQCCAHMILMLKTWTLAECLASAQQYTKREDWKKGDSKAYQYSRSNNWYDTCVAHMPLAHKPKTYFTLERCKSIAAKYKTRKEWKINHHPSYKRACGMKWVNVCSEHMEVVGNKQNRLIYIIYHFASRSIYVGLTADFNRRLSQHKKSSKSIINLIKAYCEDVKFKRLTQYIYSEKAAAEKETELAYKFLDRGWNVLNHFPALGALGASQSKYTKEECVESAKNFNRPQDWRDADAPIVTAAKKYGWYKECVENMPLRRKQVPKGYYTVSSCMESAIKFNAPAKWKKANPSAYGAALRLNILSNCTAHMTRMKYTPIEEYSFETCLLDAQKYSARNDWNKSSPAYYRAARKQGFFDDCVAHMKEVNMKPYGYWTEARCKESAKNYEAPSQWQKSEPTAYKAAREKKWLNDCTQHMTRKYKPVGYWTLERCREQAERYESLAEWRKKNLASYDYAKRQKWVELCTEHVKNKRTKNGYWTLANCIVSASTFDTFKDWRASEPSSYASVCRNKWLSKIRLCFAN